MEILSWLIFIFVFAVIFYFTVPFEWRPPRFYTLLDKFPGPKPLPIIGNSLILLNITPEGTIPILRNLCKQYGSIFRVRVMSYAHIFVNDPDALEVILSSTQHISKSGDYEFIRPWLGDGLLTSTGAKWHSRRKILTSAFHFKILDDYIPVFHKKSQILVNKLMEHVEEPHVPINTYVTLCTLDIICETAMGTVINAQDGHEPEYVNAVHRMSELFQLRQFSVMLFTKLNFWLSPVGREHARTVKIVHNFSEGVIKQRMTEYQSRNDDSQKHSQKRRRLALLDLLIEVSKKEQHLTLEDIREEVDTFMFEGHDTTATAISWALYSLGRNPDVQDKVVEELRGIFGDSDRAPTYEDLVQMKYLEQVIKETLRLYPSVPVFSRLVEKEFELMGYTVPVHAFVTIAPYILHRDPKLYPDPEKFDPERFTQEACQIRHPFAYIPFSAGPRSCIGQRFAMMEEKVVLSAVLRSFRVESLDREEDVVHLMEIILRPKDPLRIKFTPRK